MLKQFATNMYKHLTKVHHIDPSTAVNAVFLIGWGGCILLGLGATRIVDWLERDESGQVLTTEALLRKYNDKQKKALWKVLRAKYGKISTY